MKHHCIFSVTAIAIFAMTFLSSCSSDEPVSPDPELPAANFDSRAFSGMFAPNSDKTFKLSGIESYRKDDLTHDKWEMYDYTQMEGGAVPCYTLIVFKSGKIYTPITRLSSGYGPTKFSIALGLLIQKGVVKRDREVLISRNYSIGENAVTISNLVFCAKDISTGNIRLTTKESYSGGRTGNGGQHLYVLTYDIENKASGDSYRFETIEDAYTWVINLFRENFGEEVNLNNYTGGAIILDNPTFNVGMIETELQYYLSGDLPIVL